MSLRPVISDGEPIDPPEGIYAVVKIKRCEEHVQPTMQHASQHEDVAEFFAEQASPFSCGICTYGVVKYIPAPKRKRSKR